MTIIPIKSLDEYKRVKESLRDRFESERSGDQDLFVQQTKILQPLINTASTQQATLKALQENQAETNLSLQKTHGSLQQLQTALPMIAAAQAHTPQDSFKEADDVLHVDVDAQLDDTDMENLQDMSMTLPSVVLKNQNIEETLNKIATENRRIGQKLGVKSTASQKEKELYRSQKETLVTYKQIIEGLEGAKQFMSTPKKGKGLSVDTIYYASVDDLCEKLAELNAAKRAGHTGVNNHINSILDELLKIKAIDKNQYNTLYKNIFSLTI